MTINRYDPTRTTLLRKAYAAEMQRRVREVIASLVDMIVTKDCFGLDDDNPPVPDFLLRNAKEFAFHSTSDKIKEFQKWFKVMVESKMLGVDKGVDPKRPWLSKYVDSAYKKGVVDSYISSHKAGFIKDPNMSIGKEQFLSRSFGGPITTQRLEILYTRDFEQLKGITAQMSSNISRELTAGLANGLGPRQIASNLAKEVSDLGKKRAVVLARTEIIHSYAEGQLDTFEDLGVDELDVDVEFSSAGDDRVCPRCLALSGKIYTVKEARGIIPVHPQCRCAWVPAVLRKGKKRHKGELAKEATPPRDYATIKRDIAATQKELQQIRQTYGDALPPAVKAHVKEIEDRQKVLLDERQRAIAAGTPTATPAAPPVPIPVPPPKVEVKTAPKTEEPSKKTKQTAKEVAPAKPVAPPPLVPPAPTPAPPAAVEKKPAKEKKEVAPKPVPTVKAPKETGELSFLNGSRTLTKAEQKKAEEVIKGQLEHLGKFSGVADFVKNNNTNVTLIKTGDHVPNAPPGSKVLGVYYKDQKQIWMAADRNHMTGPASTGGWQVTSSLDGTFRHEFGHHFYHNKLTEAQFNEWQRIAKPYVKTEDGEDISVYASTNASELFAEAFSFFTAPNKEGSLPQPIQTFLKTHVGEKKK